MTWFPPEAETGRGTPTVNHPTTTKSAPSIDSGSKLIAALEKVWAKIQHFNPDAPNVVFITGSGRVLFGLKLGHFAKESWTLDDDDKRHELFVGGEGLARGARDVLGTLLHEGSHGIAHVRGIQDTSRQNRYHNAKFRDIAREVGIEVEHDSSLGWSTTFLPDRTADLYADEIRDLEEAIRLHRGDPLAGLFGGAGGGKGWGDTFKGPRPTPKNPPAPVYTCGCDKPRRVRMSRADFEAGPLHCGICDKDFEVREEVAA